MNCPECEKQGKSVKLKVTNTYSVGSVGFTQRTQCPACGGVFTVKAFLVRDAKSAYKEAKEIEEGKD